MTNRECARFTALSALLPFAQSRLEDMAESDSDCLFYREGAAAFALGTLALNDGTTPKELAACRAVFTDLCNERMRHEDALAETCGADCPCKVKPV